MKISLASPSTFSPQRGLTGGVKRFFLNWMLVLAVIGVVCPAQAAGIPNPADKLLWNKSRDVVDADVRDLPLVPLLERIANQTGWHVQVEPAPDFRASARFTGLPSGEALRRLLPELNYVFLPHTNRPSELFVFRSAKEKATQKISGDTAKDKLKATRVPNELLLRLKPGTDADALAKSLGAKITGRMDKLGLYRLEFPDEDATEVARASLSQNNDVATVDYNYIYDQPQPNQNWNGSSSSSLASQLKPPVDAKGGRVIIGLIDTAVQSTGTDWDKFVLPQVSVAGKAALDPNEPSHGTVMVGTMVEQFAKSGSTEFPQILPVDAYGNDPHANTWNVAAAIVEAVNRGANPINLSLGGSGDSAVLAEVIKAANEKGIVIVAAAGNTPGTQNVYPAAYEGVIAVTDVQDGHIAYYANSGDFVDAAAPGRAIVQYADKLWGAQGTSVSSALVTAVVAATAERTSQPVSQGVTAILKSLPVPRTTVK